MTPTPLKKIMGVGETLETMNVAKIGAQLNISESEVSLTFFEFSNFKLL